MISSLGREKEEMKVTQIDSSAEATMPCCTMSEKQLRDEIDSCRAEKLARKMLDKGLITEDEYTRITAECRRVFVPFLSEIT